MFKKFLRNLLSALAFAMPSFTRGKDEASNKNADPIESVKPSKLQPGGQIEEVNKHYGRTIAGGPGSQKIGDTFDALPKEVREAMIAARKGKIIRTNSDGLDAACGIEPQNYGVSGTDKIARALANRRRS